MLCKGKAKGFTHQTYLGKLRRQRSMVKLPSLAAAHAAAPRSRSPPACSGLPWAREGSPLLLGCQREGSPLLLCCLPRLADSTALSHPGALCVEGGVALATALRTTKARSE